MSDKRGVDCKISLISESESNDDSVKDSSSKIESYRETKLVIALQLSVTTDAIFASSISNPVITLLKYSEIVSDLPSGNSFKSKVNQKSLHQN